ncbi:hypothetical protein ACFYWN_46500 [Streptomyces sp. NPDC002917]|uniref:hypothetical protein n=1 Tax=Streptomyces sp. NPDC002917 TaxID=3364671 RepID=UPI0036B3D82F
MPFEYAATLGLIDVQYIAPDGARDDSRHMWGADWLDRLSRYDGLIAVQLNPPGAAVTDRRLPAGSGVRRRGAEFGQGPAEL